MFAWDMVLSGLVLAVTIVTLILLTLPSQWHPYSPDLIHEDQFSEEDKKKEASGYGYFSKWSGPNKTLKPDTSVSVVVLGDIGRSPRMQYHATSIAAHGGRVNLVGYVDSEILPEIRANRFIDVVPLKPIPEQLRTSSTATFIFIAPLKVLFQIWSLYHALGYRSKATKWMLVQNPPSIPTLLVAQFVCLVRNTRLVIDWHNFGYTILAMRLGETHPLVKLSEWYERFVAGWAEGHFAVTNAMSRVLKQKYGIEALPLHDRPANQFQPLSSKQRLDFLQRCPETAKYADRIMKKHMRLVVSSTSWTADEDFSILLDALVAYNATVAWDKTKYPKILAIITGKGPLQQYYLNKLEKLNAQKKLSNTVVKTAWLSPEDYASLLGSADLGVSLHTSSSGVDLPMKVVDMFGTGLPVLGYSKFEAWPELVKENVNGRGFSKAEELDSLLEELFGGKGAKLDRLREGAMKECDRRWDDEWFPVAGKVFKLKSKDELFAAPEPRSSNLGSSPREAPTSSTSVEKPSSPVSRSSPVASAGNASQGGVPRSSLDKPLPGQPGENKPLPVEPRETPAMEDVPSVQIAEDKPLPAQPIETPITEDGPTSLSTEEGPTSLSTEEGPPSLSLPKSVSGGGTFLNYQHLKA